MESAKRKKGRKKGRFYLKRPAGFVVIMTISIESLNREFSITWTDFFMVKIDKVSF